MNRARTVVPACVVLAEEVWGSALHVTRSLGRAGVPVFVATAGSGAVIYGRSRYCTAAADFDPSDSVRFCVEVRDWAQGLVQDDQPVMVLPLSDRLVEFLHESRDAFPDQFKLAIPSPEATEALLTKEESLRIAERAGLDVPRWVLVSSPEDLRSLERLRMPVAVRPTSWSTVGGKYFKIAVCRSRETLSEELLGYLDAGAELIVQEYVEASEEDVELAIVWRSEDRSSTAVCTGRKRRQSAAEGGVMIWGETVPLPGVRDGALRFLDASGFTGLGGIEFIRSQGRSWFIEFNPRLEAIHFLAARSGIDTVRMAYRDLALGAPNHDVPEQKHATAWMGGAWLQRLSSDRSYRWTAIRDWWAFVRAPGRVRAVWTWRDPVPGLVLSSRLAVRAMRSLLRRRSGTPGKADFSMASTPSPQSARSTL